MVLRRGGKTKRQRTVCCILPWSVNTSGLKYRYIKPFEILLPSNLSVFTRGSSVAGTYLSDFSLFNSTVNTISEIL